MDQRTQHQATGGDQPEEPGSDWLLHGRSDPDVVETGDAAPPEITLMAAE